ncbi:uncharacterized protein MKK02DRAFT_36638 [Dioszegia hungarica]|uniref:Glycosyltransferase 61 catalytic domain-containing protein n=1 Tax=Dioszegia hungarica TaxID=4972 RepID=A0AA38LS17_9TREE|nr:uncharacterized protein MKK02DRAFT_36638 [Dioszegia hungarica]KAI9635262.1 hypothetical protein MKK02DRAFT_36638 [Dioszegia hungarica]
MTSFNPTKRDLLIVLAVTTVLGLLLQFDTFRFADGAGGSTLLGSGGNFRAGDGDGWLESVETGARYAAMEKIAGMGQNKVKWGEGGAMETEVLAHAPGWTIFDQLYLFNGTWYIVSDRPHKIPLLRMMTSTGNEIWNDEESIAGREPTDKDMKIIFPSEAKKLWGHSASRVSETSFLINDPPQFLDHYYHFAAELLVGLWRTYSSLDTTISATGTTHLPSPARMMFPHTEAGKWNDYAKMNSFLSRAIFPSMSYEYASDFHDRTDTARAFLFERVVFADRAAAWRGKEFQRTYRTTSEAVTLAASKYWWYPVRKNLLDFVGSGDPEAHASDIHGVGFEEDIDEDDVESAEKEEAVAVEQELDAMEKIDAKQAKNGKPVITYVSRQDWGRRMLLPEAHASFVEELNKLEEKYGWEVHVVAMDKLSRDEQIRLAARSTIMCGIHGNGLTHLLWMNSLNPKSTVIEFFFPGGFAEDYEFTARALGIRHYGIWDDTSFTYPDLPQLAYPEGFQGNEIPLNGKAVADLIVERLLLEKPEDVAERDGEA